MLESLITAVILAILGSLTYLTAYQDKIFFGWALLGFIALLGVYGFALIFILSRETQVN